MSHKNPSGLHAPETNLDQPLYTPIKRRSFFMYAGATAGATALVLAGCKDDNDNNPGMVNVGTGDVGVLNYAYALEQLEADFYTKVRMGSYYTSLASNNPERLILDDLYYHEVIHRDFLQAAITGAGATPIRALTTVYPANTFNSRATVLGTAMAFEDLGVAAYNGAGQYFTSPGNLFLAGKIVSVEARHAAIIRDLMAENSFVDNSIMTITSASNSSVATNNAPVNSSLERSKSPAEVIATANTFLADGFKLDVSGLR